MNTTQQFLIEQNVQNYIAVLAWEVDPESRKTYSDLLRLEEDRYAREVAHLDVIDSWIKKCDRHIAQLRTLMGKRGVFDCESNPECRRLIEGMLETKAVLVSLRQMALGSVDVAEAFLARRSRAEK